MHHHVMLAIEPDAHRGNSAKLLSLTALIHDDGDTQGHLLHLRKMARKENRALAQKG